MVDDNPPAPSGAETNGMAAGRLNSWKEIASYLGKGVRTVQRWEVQMGLPVRRLGREGGEIVYALKSEIDAWILKGGHGEESDRPPEGSEETRVTRAAPTTVEETTLHSTPPPERPPHPGNTAVRFPAPSWPWAILALVGIVGIAMTLAQRSGSGGHTAPVGNPVGAVFETGVLRTWDSEGRPLWRHPFASAVDNRLDTRISVDTTREHRRIAVEDLDGDGNNEVLVISISPSGSGDSLHVYNADGSLRFTHIPGRPVTWGSKVYKGFNANSMYFLREPDGSLGLWVTASHVSWFPSLLQRLSPRGELLSEYWSNGVIRTIRPANLKGHRYLFVGAYNNETRGGSLALLDMAHASGTAPAERSDYRCLDCAGGEPAEFLVFPASDVLAELTADGGSAHVLDARLVGEDEVVVTVYQAGAKVPGETDVVDGTVNYTLSSDDLRLKQLEVLWGYVKIHRSLQAAGRLRHGFGPREETQLARIRRWSHGRFVPLEEAKEAGAGTPAVGAARPGPSGASARSVEPSGVASRRSN